MNDLDPVCADMAFVQYTYAGGIGQVHTGDFLRMKPDGHMDTPLTHIALITSIALAIAEKETDHV